MAGIASCSLLTAALVVANLMTMGRCLQSLRIDSTGFMTTGMNTRTSVSNLELLGVYSKYVDATELAKLERKYGGKQWAKRHQKSAHENKEPYGTTMQHVGGDRFGNKDPTHDYASTYATYLNKLFDAHGPIQKVAEVGILEGSGIATWLELFPGSKVYGFDIDPSNFEANRANLKKEGMNDANLQIVTMDQTLDNTNLLKDKIGGTFSFVMDDGCHSEFCARLTIKSFMPFMADTFLYIIEDSAGLKLIPEIQTMGANIKAVNAGALTVVSRGL